MEDRAEPLPRPVALSRTAALLAAVLIAVTFMGFAVANRLPVLFPDTMAYNSAGEAVLGALGGHDRRARHAPAAGSAISAAAPAGVSEARSPYYGFVLALFDRGGGVWLAALAQAAVAAAALVLALRRFGLTGTAGMATVAAVILGGLGFYAVVLLPDIFLGPVILALAFLPTSAAMPRRERLFWAAILVAGLLFHRSFLAVALVLVAGSALAWRARWFSRRGWLIAAAATLVAALGHAAVGPAVERVYGAKVASPPFVLARMVEGSVVPAYLADVCPTRHFLLCRQRGQLPMDHQQFLWAIGPDGAFNRLSLADRQRLIAEATPIVTEAIAARPVTAAVEALRYSVNQFFFAGMDDFTQRVPTRWRIDPALQSAMAAYPASGICAGDFALHTLSRITLAVYLVALAMLVAAVVAVARPVTFGRQRVAPADWHRLVAVSIIVAGVIVNAAVSGTLSGLQDRYAGRIAWLASLAAAALLAEAVTTTRRLATRVR